MQEQNILEKIVIQQLGSLTLGNAKLSADLQSVSSLLEAEKEKSASLQKQIDNQTKATE